MDLVGTVSNFPAIRNMFPTSVLLESFLPMFIHRVYKDLVQRIAAAAAAAAALEARATRMLTVQGWFWIIFTSVSGPISEIAVYSDFISIDHGELMFMIVFLVVN
ncbi:hypothetical protein QQP08_004228 [Theobroma cacao]|nr:hypothetical protein QQP08_004228 [Theobroma cacao]